MLRTLAERGDQRPLVLIYANKDWDSVIFREKIQRLQNVLNLDLVHVLEKPPVDWSGETGFITQDILERHLPGARRRNTTEVFTCGPPPMINAVEKALVNLGVPFGDFHSERFNLV
jgi:predicted ferric reductase